jgi:hypothetical protein
MDETDWPTGGMVLVPLTELMRRYNFSESWFRARLVEGMPGRRYGRRWRFDPEEIERWMGKRYPQPQRGP